MPRHCCPNAVEFNSRLAKTSRVNNMKNVRLLFSALRTFLGKQRALLDIQHVLGSCVRLFVHPSLLMCVYMCVYRRSFVRRALLSGSSHIFHRVVSVSL